MEIAATLAGSAGREWRRGWTIVLSAAIGIAVVGVHYHVVGAMIRPLGAAYGWSRGDIAMALTISSLIGPLANVGVGIIADRLGPRPVVLVGCFLFGASYSLFALSGPSLWSWYAAAVIYAVLSHGIGTTVWTMAIVRSFRAGRGLALAASLSGAGLLVAIMPTIVLALVSEFGIRPTFLILGASGTIITFIPAFFFFKERPADGATARAQGADGSVALPGASVRDALLHTQFWRLAVALFIVSATVGMFIVHLQPMFVDSGLTATQAASAAFMMGPMMIVGRLGTGALFDRLPAALVASVAFAFPVLCCSLVLGFDGTMMFAILITSLIGLSMGAEVDVVAYLCSRYFGLKNYGVLFGILIGLYGIGVGVGSTVAGTVFDRTGNYDAILIVLGAGCALAGLLVGTLGRPAEPVEQAAVAARA